MIHVCFSLYDKTGSYSKFTGTAMLSLLENCNTPPSVTVHILHDNTLTTENRDKFSYVAGQYHQLVKFYNVEKLCADKINEIVKTMPSVKTSIFTVAALYRLLIPQLLSSAVDKCIYLDSDVIVNLDIKELWQIELDDKLLAVVTEASNDVVPKSLPLCADGLVAGEDYFNSGVLVMNLPAFNKEWNSIMRGIMFIENNRKYRYPDQDMLNYCFSTRTVKLSRKFNRSVGHERSIKDINLAGKIHHFYGCALSLKLNDPFNRLWMDYFMKTPWFDAQTISKLYTGVQQQLNIVFKQKMINLTALMSGKTRGFFVAPPNVEVLKKFFSIRDDEEIITADSQESLIKLLESMKRNHGKKIFFIMLPNFPFQILTQAGFVPGSDFVNGFDFLSEAQGVPLNSYQLIKEM